MSVEWGGREITEKDTSGVSGLSACNLAVVVGAG